MSADKAQTRTKQQYDLGKQCKHYQHLIYQDPSGSKPSLPAYAIIPNMYDTRTMENFTHSFILDGIRMSKGFSLHDIRNYVLLSTPLAARHTDRQSRVRLKTSPTVLYTVRYAHDYSLLSHGTQAM